MLQYYGINSDTSIPSAATWEFFYILKNLVGQFLAVENHQAERQCNKDAKDTGEDNFKLCNVGEHVRGDGALWHHGGGGGEGQRHVAEIEMRKSFVKLFKAYTCRPHSFIGSLATRLICL